MNFDDDYTKESEEKFQKYLQEATSIPPEAYKLIEENLLFLRRHTEKLKNMPDKSPEELLLLMNLESKIKEFVQKLDDIKLILDMSLYRQSVAYYEKVKKLAKEGNLEAKKIYDDLKIHFEKFDAN